MDKNLVLYDLLSADEFKDYLNKNGVDISLDVSDDVIDAVVRRANVLLNGTPDDLVRVDSVTDDVIGHLLLRGLATVNDKIEKWFVNNEAELLKERFLTIMPLKRLRILKEIFGKRNILTVKDFLRVTNHDGDHDWLKEVIGVLYRMESDKYLVVRWDIVHRLVSKHRCKLYGGWAFVESGDAELGSIFTQAVRSLLEVKINSTSFPDETREILAEELEDQILESIQRASGTIVGYDDITEKMVKFPLCIRMLDSYLVHGKELGHQEMLQLGFFLKSIGFTLEDYRKYFYYRHPSNKGKSYDEFVHSHWGGYQLKHHFGEVGGGKDYSSFKCETIVKEGFCPYADLKGTERRKVLEAIYGELRKKAHVDRLLSEMTAKLKTKTPFTCQIACSLEFHFRFDFMFEGGKVVNIWNPINYYRLSDRIIDGKMVEGETVEITRRKRHASTKEESENASG